MKQKKVSPKKRLVISYKNLAVDLQEELKIKYPNGFTDHMIRIEKGFNDFFYAVMLETDEITYLVKIEVKIDADGDIDDDKDDFADDELKNVEEISGETELDDE